MSLAGITLASIGAHRVRRNRPVSRTTTQGLIEHLQLTQDRRELEKNALLNYDGSQGARDILAAVEEDDVEAVEAAVAGGAPINARVEGREFPGQTPLVCSVRLGKFRCFSALVQLGADPFIPDDKHRDAWYYCCFGRNLKDGEHKVYMNLLLEKWRIDGKVMLLAMHSQHAGVRLAAINSLPVEIKSRDSQNNCKLRLQNLGALDDDSADARLVFPDGSKSKEGLTPFQQMLRSEAVESIAQPPVLALMNLKWERFAGICFYIDMVTYLMTLVSISIVALMFPFYTSTESIHTGRFYQAQVFNLFANALMLAQEAVVAATVCQDQSSFWPLFGRPLHAFTSCALAFLFEAMSMTSDSNIIACGDVLAAAVIFTWMRMLYFIRLSRGFGSFCIILIEMIKRDVAKFLILLAGILPGFIIAMHMMILLNCNFDDLDAYAGQRWMAPWELTANMIFMMMGVQSWDSPQYECLDRSTLTVIVMLFLLMSAIVLLNLMIAMFSDTYERIQTQAVHQWAYNLAMYIRDKEVLVRYLRVPRTVMHLGKECDGWLYTCDGKYNDYFIPPLRGDVDDRPEEYIVEQLEEMWKDMQGRQSRVEELVKGLKRHLVQKDLSVAVKTVMVKGKEQG